VSANEANTILIVLKVFRAVYPKELKTLFLGIDIASGFNR